ncbi:MAG: thiamine diphosphokinase [Ilumatobacteraceae bacterium]|nr:thiamine diphosphokinase [Ilumatobacteraceae bacterium]
MNESIVIITGSAPLAPAAVDTIPDEAIVLAVDGGLDHALAAGVQPSGLIGDLDSVTEPSLVWAARNATIDRHPTDKDQTDTELALAFAVAMTPDRLMLVGGGDRLDHTIAALGALGAPALTSIPTIEAWWGDQHVRVIHGPGAASLELVPGSTLSLLALHGTCRAVSISGVRWPLDEVELAPVVGHGVSNEVGDDGVIDVQLSAGVLTVFDRPRLATDSPPTSAGTAPTTTTATTPTTTSSDDSTETTA